MDDRTEKTMLGILSSVAPGSLLRMGLDRVLEAGRGGLIVIGDGPEVLEICSGGFLVDAPFSPQKLSELSKMDGAIILDSAVSKISRANVHLLPDSTVSTSETGTRHRTAERVARSLKVPVVAVSESRSDIHVYLEDLVHSLLSDSRLLERSNQAIQTLERYRLRLDTVSKNLSLLEVEDLVSLRDVLEVIQRAEMVIRISNEIKRNLIELGTSGRLIRFQLEELMVGVTDDRRLLLRDYLNVDSMSLAEAMDKLTELDDEELFDDSALASSLKLSKTPVDIDELMTPKGFRILNKLPRIHEALVERLVDEYGSLNRIIRADTDELANVHGVGEARAQALKQGTMRLVENSFFDRF